MSIENSMLRIGRILSADYGLKVEVRGKLAYAKPGVVVLPSISSFEWLGHNAERMLHGLLDHEVGHALFSDFSLAAIEDPRLKTLWNAIEDGYVERAMRRKFPGCAFNLKSKNDWYWTSEGKTQTTLADADPWSAFCLALTMILRGTITVKDVEPLRPEVALMLRTAAKHIKRAHAVESTTQAYAVALDIYDVFRSPAPPPPEDDETEDEESPPTPAPEDSQEGDDEAEAEESPSDDEEDEEDPEEGQDEGTDADSSSDEEEAGSEEEEPADEGEEENDGEELDDEGDGAPDDEGSEEEQEGSDGSSCETPEIESEPEEDLTESEDENGKEIIPTLDPADFDPEEPLTPEDAFMRATDEALEGRYVNYSEEPEYTVEHDVSGLSFNHTHEYEMASAREASHVLSQTFEAALLARREKRLIGGHDEGEIDVALLGEYACGAVSSDALYQQPFAEDDRDVAVAILLDCSGSMGGQKALVARQTAYAMSLALSTCGIEHEITGFTTMSSRYTRAPFDLNVGNYRHVFQKLREGLKEGEERGVPATSYAREVYGDGESYSPDLLVPIHCVLKSFDETRLDGISYAHGYAENLDGEAVRWQALRLAQRREPRRVMFVLSDGLPAGHRSEHPGDRFLRETVERVNEAGIETYGIGICSDAVKRFYARSWVVRNLQDLMEISMGAMIETLVSARQEHACVRL